MRSASLFLLLEFVLLSGCMYHLVRPNSNSVFVEVFSNKSVQPGIETALYANLKKTFAEKQGFTLAENAASANIVLSGTITDFTRNTGFFTGNEEPAEGNFTVKLSLSVYDGKKTDVLPLSENYRMNLVSNPGVDFLLDQIAKKLSLDIYFFLLQHYGN